MSDHWLLKCIHLRRDGHGTEYISTYGYISCKGKLESVKRSARSHIANEKIGDIFSIENEHYTLRSGDYVVQVVPYGHVHE